MYHTHFGLSDEPFKFLPSNTLFRSGAHLEGLAALEWAFREPSGLTLLAGEVGTGKTMLIHTVITRLDDDHVRIAQINNPTLTFDEMLGVILEQIRIYPAGKGKFARLQAIKTFIADPASKDRVILIFDEAQGLSDETLEELRLLSNSRPPQRNALQIVFVGQPELVERLADPKLRALNQRIGARALLRPLRGAEIHDYVNYLLQAQGARYEIFSPRALDEVVELSEGLPRKINNLCHNSLLRAYAEQNTVVEPRHVRAASAELENLLEVSDLEGEQAMESQRDAAHRMGVNGKAIILGAGSALAVIACVLAFEFAGRPGLWFGHRANTKGGHATGGISRPLAGSPGETRERSGVDAHPAPLSSVSANPVVAPPTQAKAAQAAPPLTPTKGAGITASTLTNPVTSVPPEKPGTAGYASPNAMVSTAAAPNSARKLTPKEERRLEYELKRATASLEAGRYSNAIYHLKRAQAVRPGNRGIGELLQRARRAQSAAKSSSFALEPAPAPITEDAPVTDDSAAPPSNISVVTFAKVVEEEIAAGDAYMRAGKYDSALRKFRTAAVLEPNNPNVADRIARAQRAQTTMGNVSQ